MRQLVLLAGLIAGPALATQGGGLNTFAPPPGDVSVDYLAQVFGGPIMDSLRTAGGGLQAAGESAAGQTVLGGMMAVFNSAVLLLAMLFVLYTTIKGTVDSAHDGELLGRKMSSIYVPLRTVGGSAFLLPLGSGFSLIQVAVLWLAIQGAGVATAIWNAAMEQLSANGTLGSVSVPDARPLAANILRSEVCMAAMNKHYQDAGESTRIELNAESTSVSLGAAPAGAQRHATERYVDRSYSWRATGWTRNADLCGSITLTESVQGGDIPPTLRNPLLAAHSEAVRAMIDELRPVAAAIVESRRLPDGALDAAASRYKVTLQEAARQAIAATPDAARTMFIQYARDGGWVMAGSWWSAITRLNTSIQTAVNAMPTAKAATIEAYSTENTLITYRSFLIVTEEFIKDRAGTPRAEAAIELTDVRTADDVWKVLSIPAVAALDNLTRRIAGDTTSPLTQLRAIGNDIINIGIVLKGAVFSAAGVLGARSVDWTVGNVFNVLEAVKTLAPTVEWLSNTLWVLGAMLAYALPAVPVIAWVLGVTRWLAGVAEAVLASSLLAAFHVHPDGDDLVGRAGPGYMLILAMIMQPALMVFALVLSVLMMYPAGALVNAVFLQMVAGTSAGSGVGLIGLVAWTTIYVTMMTLVVHSCTALINAVPDAVMRYVAAQAGAQGIVKSADDAYHRMEGGAAGAGSGLSRGGPMAAAEKGQQGGGGRGGDKTGRVGNSISNADLMDPPTGGQ